MAAEGNGRVVGELGEHTVTHGYSQQLRKKNFVPAGITNSWPRLSLLLSFRLHLQTAAHLTGPRGYSTPNPGAMPAATLHLEKH